MMDNLARIISHGFAVVVVILLGIGFVYRGELFPDLELPDFLVPESAKVADAGDHPGRLQPESAAPQDVTAGETVAATPSAPAVPTAPPVDMPVTSPEVGTQPSGAAPPGMTGESTALEPAPQVAEETETVTGVVVETLQVPAEEPSPPLPTESGFAEGASPGSGEAGGELATDTVPPPVPSEESPAEPRVEVPDAAVSAPSDTPTDERSAEPVITMEPPSPVDSREPAAAEEPSSPAATGEEGTSPATGVPVPGSMPVTAAEMQPDTGSTGKSVPVKPYELLAAAREAFWLHNYDDAEANYRALTELEPGNPDGYGELGNMYFSQGRWEEAAAAYYEAGTRLVAEGRLDSARELVTVIRGLNGQQADELDKLITAAASTGNQ